MCGRARLSSDVSEIRVAFRIPPERPAPNFPPSWNVAPTDSLPIVRFYPKEGQRSLDMMRWGLIPYWAKDIKVGFANINARLIAKFTGGPVIVFISGRLAMILGLAGSAMSMIDTAWKLEGVG
jgi:putative SOS response-associated peptidase YedK